MWGWGSGRAKIEKKIAKTASVNWVVVRMLFVINGIAWVTVVSCYFFSLILFL